MECLEWVEAKEGQGPPTEYYCPTRDIAEGRTVKLLSVLLQAGWTDDESGLLIAVTGELVGNCFDHNLGKWRDIAGCWLEWKIVDDGISIFVADRGQGVYATLREVEPGIMDAREALSIAFTKTLSGRAPERRGNGLKFVLRSLRLLKVVRSFHFLSGTAGMFFDRVSIQKDPRESLSILPKEVFGTYAEILLEQSL